MTLRGTPRTAAELDDELYPNPSGNETVPTLRDLIASLNAGTVGSGGGGGVATPSGTYLISGGGVAWLSGYTYAVAAADYVIAGTEQTSAPASVTLGAADATNPRIDAIVVDAAGLVSVLAGTPAVDPAHPDIDPALYLELTFVLVDAASSAPSTVATTLIYAENLGTGGGEWDATTSGAAIVAGSLSNPATGTKDVEATAAASGQWAMFTAGAGLDLASRDQLVFALRSKATWPNPKYIRVGWRASGVQKGVWVTVKTGTFGFDSSVTGAYQQIVIPLTQFSVPAGTLINELRVEVQGGGGAIGWYLDDVGLQAGVQQPATTVLGINWRGPWSSTAAYAVRDAVSYLGSSWIAVVANTNSAPSETNTNWNLLAAGAANLTEIAGSLDEIGTPIVFYLSPMASAEWLEYSTIPAAAEELGSEYRRQTYAVGAGRIRLHAHVKAKTGMPTLSVKSSTDDFATAPTDCVALSVSSTGRIKSDWATLDDASRADVQFSPHAGDGADTGAVELYALWAEVLPDLITAFRDFSDDFSDDFS